MKPFSVLRAKPFPYIRGKIRGVSSVCGVVVSVFCVGDSRAEIPNRRGLMLRPRDGRGRRLGSMASSPGRVAAWGRWPHPRDGRVAAWGRSLRPGTGGVAAVGRWPHPRDGRGCRLGSMAPSPGPGGVAAWGRSLRPWDGRRLGSIAPSPGRAGSPLGVDRSVPGTGGVAAWGRSLRPGTGGVAAGRRRVLGTAGVAAWGRSTRPREWMAPRRLV